MIKRTSFSWFSRRQVPHLVLFAASVGCMMVLSTLVVVPTAHGAVGTGGSGGGGGGGHQSRYGYGWRKYSVSGNGPADGFRDGTSWSHVQNRCHDDGANLAIIFVVKDSDGSAMAYRWNHWSGSDYTTAGDFISINTMEGYWADLPAGDRNGNSRANGTQPADDIAWFCYSSTNYSIDPITTGYPSSMERGAGATFTNQLKNNGSSDKTVNDGMWRVFTFVVPADQPLPTGPRNSAENVDSTAEINKVYYGGSNVARNYQWIGSSSSQGSCVTYDATRKVNEGSTRTSCVTNERTTSASYSLSNGDRICAAMLVSVYKPYVNNRRYSAPACVTITVTPVGTLSCSTGGFTGAALLINSTQSFTASATGSSTPPNKIVATVTGPAYSNTFTDTNPLLNGNTATSTFSLTTSSTPGTYTLSWYAYNSSGGSVGPCPGGTTFAGTRPYFEVSGGDVLTGPSSAASFISWNRDSGDYAGANNNLAVIATGNINGVITGKGNTSNLPKTLSFANNGSSTYGGSFSPSAIPSLGNTAPTVTTTTPSFSGGSLTGLAQGLYRAAGNVTISASTLSNKKITIVATGNVYISGNITYTYASLTDIPRLTIYASNIIIGGAVTEIHGTFRATSNFYSCGSGVASYVDYANLDTAANTTLCNTQLKVYGAVSANQLILTRTKGSWHDGSGSAEQFLQGPETWVNNTRTTTRLDNYVSLPPVL